MSFQDDYARRLQERLRSVAPRDTPVAPKCPACGGRVVYQGFTRVECATRGCVNAASGLCALPPDGTREWAIVLHDRGENVGYRYPDGVTVGPSNPHLLTWLQNVTWFRYQP